jgi:hypothetical protein
VVAFKKLLHSFYGEAYELTNMDELKCMTQLAGYYCALPAFSRSITLPLFRGDINICENCTGLIEIAAKLRHPGLFRECVIWIAGHWSIERDLSSLDYRIQKTVKNARNGLALWLQKFSRR